MWEKEYLQKGIINSFSQPLEINSEQNFVDSEVNTTNSSLQKGYADCLEEDENSLPAFATPS